jgi:hypothetical protein
MNLGNPPVELPSTCMRLPGAPTQLSTGLLPNLVPHFFELAVLRWETILIGTMSVKSLAAVDLKLVNIPFLVCKAKRLKTFYPLGLHPLTLANQTHSGYILTIELPGLIFSLVEGKDNLSNG